VKYQIAFVDLDDTLAVFGQGISVENQEAVALLQALGLQVVIASGRGYNHLCQYHDQLKLLGPIVSSNGALVKIPASDLVVSQVSMDSDVANQLIEHGIVLGKTVISYRGGIGYIEQKVDWQPSWHEVGLVEGRYSQSQAPEKVIWLDAKGHCPTLLGELQGQYQGRLTVSAYDKFVVDFAPAGVDKWAAIVDVCAYYKVETATAMAFGDHLNDVQMLKACGFGVAMSHAHPQAKLAAKYTAEEGPMETSFARAVRALIADRLVD